MPLEPKLKDFPRVRSALKFYQVCAIITGVLLLLLCVEMILKYTPIGLEVEMGGPQGFLALVPDGTVTSINLSTGILIVHGWFYVVYLFSCFQLWTRMRWRLGRFLLLALGGVIPFLSFFVETRTAHEVRGYLAEREAAVVAQPTEAAHQ
ncbi:DUF3817 domain-containing protein [Subtercola endophyticus]|uniref:DUF3817 domain-containing protein n=1 Tax=Subtercola endophyticus TaxID=2895559 RepID=UPI001E3D7146|nr:DUF3817 domain-containing protein [Subtercola endophyticus]UFS59384.1 DUF3817 domain-containing protein [Subtercola endophyticus]